MAGALGRLRLCRAQVIRTALFVDHAETAAPVRIRDHREHFFGVHSTPCHVREDLVFFVCESGHHLGVIFNACFEVARKEAQLSPESPKLVPGPREVARDDNSQTINDHLSRIEARGGLPKASLASLFVLPRTGVGELLK